MIYNKSNNSKKSFDFWKKAAARVAALCLSILMTSGLLPWGDILEIFAYDEATYSVNKVIVTKIYEKGRYEVSQTKIALKGSSLQGISIVAETSQGLKTYSNPQINTQSAVEFLIDGNVIGETITVGSADISIDQANIPTISQVDKRVVKAGAEGIVLTGANLERVGTSEGGISYEAYFEDASGSSGQKELPVTDSSEGSLSTGSINGTLGLQNIIFKKEYSQEVDFKNESGKMGVEITVQNTYNDQFRLIDEIVMEGLNMNPNRGQVGDEVIFTAEGGLDDYDVFIMKKLTDKFTRYNKCEDPVFRPDVDGKQTLTVRLPDYKEGYIENGEYYVVITNKIPEGADPDGSINKQHVLSEKFTIIDASQKMKILPPLQPDKGPDSGARVEISGVFFGSLNISEFSPDIKDIIVEAPSGSDEIMNISYSEGVYKGTRVTSATRQIKVLVGSVAKFAKTEDGSAYECSFEPQLDKITVITPQVTDAETDPVKDVVVETVTVITLEDGKTVTLKDRAELEKGYEYEPSKITPTPLSVTPQRIYVKDTGSGYEIQQDTMVAAYGRDILIYKYTDEDGSEQVRYPILELGASVRLNKNENLEASDPELFLKVFDNSGKELDGSTSNQIGSKILAVIPAGTRVENLGKTFIKIINPVKNDVIEGRSGTLQYAVEFVNPDISKIPVIESVTPNVTTIDGGEEIVISGSNFQVGVEVIIDGEAVSGVKRQQDGRKLTFKVPKGREGATQIQVVNPEGGIAISGFRYVKTYTDPKINSFSPEDGSSRTLVVIKGDNFVKPDPTSGDDDPLKLVGTRVLLGGNDISSYNRDPLTREIVLKGYKAPEPDGDESQESGKLIGISGLDGSLRLEDYYHSVVMEDEIGGRFFTIDVDSKGEIQLSNGTEKFTIYKSGEEMLARRDAGDEYVLMMEKAPSDEAAPGHDDSDYIWLYLKRETEDGAEYELKYRMRVTTPFTVDSNTGLIDGDKVKVKGIDELYFWVPVMGAEGYYDITVQNPDTKKDSKTGEDGFYYYKQPYSNPVITGIEPPEGSVEGGYAIRISATSKEGRECFVDNGSEKTKVFINGVEVESSDVEVSTDGFSIDAIVPPAGVDIQEKYGVGRLSVPVVVTNPDGGTDSVEEGFTYVVPTSHPSIAKLVPPRGSAAGGNIVEMTGSDFRFFEPYTDSNGDGVWNPGEPYHDLNDCHVSFEDADNPPVIEGDPDMSMGPDDFSGMDIQKLKDDFGDDYGDIVEPVLPKVYFGSSQAQIQELSAGYIKVKAPVSTEGSVDVYIVNNDSGISNKVSYQYESSSPEITDIIPARGPKSGGNRIEIFGSAFSSSSISVFGSDAEAGIQKSQKTMPVVRFGEVSNRDIERDKPNSGRIDSSRATVKLGELSVEYDGKAGKLKLSAFLNEKNYDLELEYGDEKIYVPLELLRDSDGVSYQVYEMVKVEVEDKRLLVDRGFSPEAYLESSGKIVVNAASYHSIGLVSIGVVNPDGGIATGEYEYKNPDSNPSIVTIEKDSRPPEKIVYDFGSEQRSIKVVKATCKGGNSIRITGNDFRENATVQIGSITNIPVSAIEYSLPFAMTFTMPPVDQEHAGTLSKVLVMNEDGASASSEDVEPESIYIMFVTGDTAPSIDNVAPSVGSSVGGEQVVISGIDFRPGISVFFGGVQVPSRDVELVDYKTIRVTTPPSKAGSVDVKVENSDGELAVLSGEFRYISSPIVSGVFESDDRSQKKKNIDVNGGEKIVVRGAGFEESSTVYFMPQTGDVEESDTPDIYVGTKGYMLVDSVQAANVEFEDSETLVVTTPEGRLDEGGIMVVNSDKGSSGVYSGVTYGLREMDAPENVDAQIIYDRYIRVTWEEVQGATEYEIYSSEDGQGYVLAATTKETSFIYRDVEPATDYRFKVRAVGEISTSIPSMETDEITTGRNAGYEDEDGELSENTSVSLMGRRVVAIIGEDDYKDETTIDMTTPEFSGADSFSVSIPMEVANSSRAADVNVIGRDFTLSFSPHAFSQSGDYGDSSGVRVDMSPSNLSAGYSGTSLSGEYEISAAVYSEQGERQIYSASSPVMIRLDFDSAKAMMRRLDRAYMASWDSYSGSWQKAGDDASTYSSSAAANVYKLGRYRVMGER